MDQVEAPTEHIAKRVRALRDARGWNAQRLADEMTKVGVEWNRGTVTKLENGRRASVSVAELLALGWVLDVPPLVLLLPDDPDANYPITPKVSARTERVYRWIVGVTPVPVETSEDEHPGKWGTRIATYAAKRPGYMARSPEENPELTKRVEAHEETLRRVLAQLEQIKAQQEGDDGER
ncbi:helix-turn-helix transcriptional regulator [Amycolatopsis cynarae]|uniref:Helix-turn-helix transcriptional regulator n=1 Tax=Amycolatopsis cynarae TaxID=2995223 RepID=A0ABY7AWU1_9PSEU|nr:helix-turn-helix transcriptional regulator [Amycolatopsis sp. HUAS 11-8]WAL64466.1 helix-turn-helix transcriptional regulator [Amycolatopsis sp. HUAS 11-8]